MEEVALEHAFLRDSSASLANYHPPSFCDDGLKDLGGLRGLLPCDIVGGY